MASRDNAADSNWREGEDSVRTVDCLRGRLLAERMASRNAKEEAQLFGNKLIELENLLKGEAKSRNRAEKKLKVLMKKLKSMNISSDGGSQHSSLGGKSDISSLSSTPTISKYDEHMHNHQMKITSIWGSEKSEGSAKSQKCPQIEFCSNSEMGSSKDIFSPEISDNFDRNDANSEKSSQIESNQSYCDSKMDQQSDIGYGSAKSSNEESFNQDDDDQDPVNVDKSMALVLVDTPQEIQTVDPDVLDATVKDVLDALRHAKEQLQSSMERRRVNAIRVG